MRYSKSLRFRVAASFTMIGGLASLIIAGGLYLVMRDAGIALMDETLSAEVQDYLARRARNPHSLPPATATLSGYVHPANVAEPPLPDALKNLLPGRQDLTLSGINYRVDVADRAGYRYYLLYNKTHFNQQQKKLLLYLVAFVALMMTVAGAMALWMAERVIAPVKELARRVRQLESDLITTHLAEDFPKDEVGELAQTFQQTLSRLAAFIDRERAFTADISHELRTPLAVIQGAAEVLLTSEKLSPNERERLERIERSAAELAELSSALLIMAREKEEARREPINVSTLVADTVEKHRHLLRNKSVRVQLDLLGQPRLAVNPLLFSSVVGNLIRNSFTHTEQGEVRLQLTEHQLVIVDTGMGISREEISRVFMRRYKGEKSTGEGIGLSLVKKICDRYGWIIELTSEPGQGTHTTLTF